MREVVKENKKLLIGLIIALIGLIIGISYAVYNYTFTGSSNTISTADISIKFLEGNDTISLTNALPQSDASGKLNDSFDFEVTTKTIKDTYISYYLTLEKLDVDQGYTALNSSNIKVYLTDGDDNVLVDPKKISEWNLIDNALLYGHINKHNSSNETIKDKYKLRVWIDSDVDASNWDSSTKLQYKFRVNVKNAKDATSDDSCYTLSDIDDTNMTATIASYNRGPAAGGMGCEIINVIIPEKITDTKGEYQVVENPSQESISSCASGILEMDDELTLQEATSVCSNESSDFFAADMTLDAYLEEMNEYIELGYFSKLDFEEYFGFLLDSGIVDYNVTSSKEYTITGIGEFAVYQSAAYNVVIPDTVTSIGEGAFTSSGLHSVTIPDSVTTIGNHAFGGNALTNLTIPSSVTSIGDSAFTANNLTSVTFLDRAANADGLTIGDDAFSAEKGYSLTLAEGITSIGKNTFFGNSLTSLTIPKSVTTIGEQAFYSGTISSVYIPSDSALTETTGIGKNAFPALKALTIYNNSGKKFKWYYVTQGRKNSTEDEYNFVTGSVPAYDYYKAVTITTGSPS